MLQTNVNTERKKVKQVQETQNEEKQKAEHEIQILDKKFQAKRVGDHN